MKIPDKGELQQIAFSHSSNIDFKDFINLYKDKKLEYDINSKAAKISTLSSGKIDKYEYLTGEEIFLPDSPLGKSLEKQTKTIEDQGEKQKIS